MRANSVTWNTHWSMDTGEFNPTILFNTGVVLPSIDSWYNMHGRTRRSLTWEQKETISNKWAKAMSINWKCKFETWRHLPSCWTNPTPGGRGRQCQEPRQGLELGPTNEHLVTDQGTKHNCWAPRTDLCSGFMARVLGASERWILILCAKPQFGLGKQAESWVSKKGVQRKAVVFYPSNQDGANKFSLRYNSTAGLFYLSTQLSVLCQTKMAQTNFHSNMTALRPSGFMASKQHAATTRFWSGYTWPIFPFSLKKRSNKEVA